MKALADAEALYTYEGTYDINSLVLGKELTASLLSYNSILMPYEITLTLKKLYHLKLTMILIYLIIKLLSFQILARFGGKIDISI